MPRSDDGQLSPTNADGDSIFQASGVQNIYFHGDVVGGDKVVHSSGTASLAAERQRLFFEFFRQALSQAETIFRISVVFMSLGATVILVGAVLALIRTGDPHFGYTPIVAALGGVLFTTAGGALAVHANRARRHLARQAERLDAKIDEDDKLEKAQNLIAAVHDQEKRDRLNAITAMRVLDMHPDGEIAAQHVLGDQEPPNQIEDR